MKTRDRGWWVLLVLSGLTILLAVVVGWLWTVFAPRATLIMYPDGGVGYLSVSESGAGVDLMFGLLAAAAGVIMGVIGFVMFPRREWYVLCATVLGGVLGSLVAVAVGQFLTPGPHELSAALADGHVAGDTFAGPLVISAKGVLGMWSLLGALTLVIGFGVRTRAIKLNYQHRWQETYGESVTPVGESTELNGHSSAG